MELLQSHAAVLAEHVAVVVFGASLIEAAGIPFPSRIILIVAAASRFDVEGLIGVGVAAIAGAAIGDHVPYLGGMLGGPRLLAFYCRITLGSERCVERTVAYFRRFGAAAILLNRLSASVRVFASVLSGCGHITYGRFVLYDLAGTLAYTTVWVSVGHVVGEHAGDLLQRHGVKLLMLVGPCALVSLLAYRLWRRRRYGVARTEALISSLPADCAPQTRARSV
jgi:membrane protein DedA with SNARE-associated domain